MIDAESHGCLKLSWNFHADSAEGGIGEERIVDFRDLPETVRVAEIVAGQMIEPLTLTEEMLAELRLRGWHGRGEKLHDASTAIGRFEQVEKRA